MLGALAQIVFRIGRSVLFCEIFLARDQWNALKRLLRLDRCLILLEQWCIFRLLYDKSGGSGDDSSEQLRHFSLTLPRAQRPDCLNVRSRCGRVWRDSSQRERPDATVAVIADALRWMRLQLLQVLQRCLILLLLLRLMLPQAAHRAAAANASASSTIDNSQTSTELSTA